MKVAAGHPYLCIYRRSGLETVLLHLSPDGTTWNPPGHAEVRWELANSGDEVWFFAGDGKCTARLRWDGCCYRGVLLESIDASLEIHRRKEFVPRPWVGDDDDARRELTVVTVANSFARGFPTVWNSCRHWGVAPLVLGFGAPFHGLTAKLHMLYAALIALEGTLKTVMFLDGFDTLMAAPAVEIMRAFREFRRPLVFSAERNCAPESNRAERYPPAPTPYRFLNSGTFIGEASYILDLFTRWDIVRWPAGANDQLMCTDAFLDDPSAFALDHYCRLFQCMYCSGDDVLVDEEGIHIRETGSRPLVVHANGGSDMSKAVEWFNRVASGN
jgi:hypothetical protein